MGPFSLRSLLLAAFVLSNYLAWTATRHHRPHNLSRHRSRHRRQGAGLYLPASYVLPGGEGSGAWGEWGEVSPCSRTCGGGVASQKRICLEISTDGQPLCTGGDTKYFSCQTQDCPADALDFRAQQCSEYDDIAFRGIKYKWLPYTNAPNPCELNCMPRGERFYFRQKAKVVDGTRCNDETFDVCVNGTCQPVGCDMMLGSNAREDKCRECRGNGTNCHTAAGVIDTTDLRKGYNDILLIPQGATSIYISEATASNNYLALRAKQDNVYYLNGEYHIDFPRSLTIAGALWHYERSQQGFAAPDKLRCLGPTTEPLYLSLLLQDENVGIEYEYSVPSQLAPPPNQQYNWVHEEFSPCSASCGGGVQTRQVTCRSREELEVVEDSLCDEGLKPVTSQACGTDPCPARWVEEPWSPCSKPCGEGGTRSRQVYCQKLIVNGFPSIVADKECFDLLGPKPELYQECNRNATCPTWFTGPWKPCDKLCGEGKQTRQVVCHQRTNGNVEIFEDAMCEEEKPAEEQTCMMHPCDGVDWVLSDWSGCDTCTATVRTRVAHCATKDHKVVDSSYCSYHPAPVLEEPCDRTKLPSCELLWYATQWSKCSVECGKGIQSRKVFCGLFDGASVLKVDDERCDIKNKYNDTKPCEISTETCAAKWYAGPWSECTKDCGGGEQYRRVMCLSGGVEVNVCPEETILETMQACNTAPCGKSATKTTASTADEDYDYEECIEEEDYPEVGAEELVPLSGSTIDDMMLSDSPFTEGSGFGSTVYGDYETHFTLESGSGSDATGTDFWTTDESGSGSTGTDSTDETTAFTSITDTTEATSDRTESELTEEFITVKSTNLLYSGSSTSEGTSETDVTLEFSTRTSDVSSTESSAGSTETVITEVSTDGSTESSTLAVSDISSVETTSASKSDGTESTIDNTKTTSTEVSGSSEGITTVADFTVTTEGTSSTDSTETGSSESSISSTPFDETETTETGSTEAASESSPSSGTEISTEESGTTEKAETLSSEFTESSIFSSTETSETDSSTTEISTESSISTISSEPKEISASESSSTTELEMTSTSEGESTLTTEPSPSDLVTLSSSSSPEVESSVSTESSEKISSVSSISAETEEIELGSSTIVKLESSGTTESETAESESGASTESGSTTESETAESESGATTESGITTESGATTETSEKETSESSSSTTEGTETTEFEASTTGKSMETETTEFSSTSSPEISSTSISELTSMSTAESSETEITSSTEENITSTESVTEAGEGSTTVSESTSETSESSTIGTESESSTESSVTEESGTTESKLEGLSTTEISTDGETGAGRGSTSWDWTSTVEVYTKKPRCRARKKIAKCLKSKFGCCPDKKTSAAGPFEEGCPNPKTCKETKYGCCPDGVSPASGLRNKGCPASPCNETLYGCCLSDNITAAEDNNQQGCPPLPEPCVSSKFGCCADGKTEASGPDSKGCPETAPEVVTMEPGCFASEFGCCQDNTTAATGPNDQGCPCSTTEFGCCPDGVSTAQGSQMEGCVFSCNTTEHGCCPDGETPAHGPGQEGCCLQYPFGCCPDNYKPAEGPHLEGCGCQYARFGCCPDNTTIARGSNNEGCGCQYTEFGCCPDRHTEAKGPDYEGCPCSTYQFGCCMDGVSIATGPNLQGCLCQHTQYGCCGDEITEAMGPDKLGCDCATSKYGCCPDGKTEAEGEKFFGCADAPENRQAACSLPTERGSCRNYTVYWYYDMEYGGCSRFWYGGCEGNGNRFTSKEECEDVCVQPPPKDACNLPKVKGACIGYHLRWYFDAEQQVCGQFVFGGCLGNANNFDTRELCKAQCEPVKNEDVCALPIEEGPCAGNYARWAYSAETRRCYEFVWGGCAGNGNRFRSEAACMQRCNPPGSQQPECYQAQDAGNCTEKHAAWSFSQTENRCVPFYYTGCGGNGNRYDTEQSCTASCPSTYEKDICILPAETGDCADYTEKWFYDTAAKTCRQFYYGGCGGNDNKFDSQQQCEARCSEKLITTTTEQPMQTAQPIQSPQTAPPVSHNADFCSLELDPGPCDQLEDRWGYDKSVGTCTSFMYGGCGGNRNNFPSQEYCNYYCPDEQLQNRFEPETQVANICQLPMRSGPCSESLMRWFYDPSSDSCSQFTYGGCEGNENRFETLEACERRCRSGASVLDTTTVLITTPTTTTPTTTASASIDPVPQNCRVSPILEECSGLGTVWYLDSSRQCVSHQNEESGVSCRHTGVFNSQEACERNCGAFRNIDVCRYPMDAGPCRSFETKFYFDSGSNRCQQFLYGGCHGGPNRFSTFEECEEICRPETDPCKQRPEPGNCLAYLPMWYYDEDRDDCNQFVYGGCNGNDNRFDTREDCERRCKKQATVPTTTTTVAPTTIAPITESSTTSTTTTTTTTTIATTTTQEIPLEEFCRPPPSLEPCGTNSTVYYYEAARGACLRADFGNCRYQNSYRSEEECERRCGAFRGLDVCGSRLDPGPCQETGIMKVYWDAESGRCQPFAYGGCLGGPNRFSTIDECEEVCGATGPDPACLQLLSMGSSACGQPSRRWHYSTNYGDCLSFIYFGCEGNLNNFVSYEECADVCKIAPIADTNEVLPDCDSYNAECASLRCAYGVQRTRTSSGCERCACVHVEIDCEPLRLECERLKCYYGVLKSTDDDGCERCRCLDHPCATKQCAEGERCVPSVFRDPVLQEITYIAGCNIMNKTGSCPSVEDMPAVDGSCRRECNDDADCRGEGKCCERGCSQLCTPPAAAATSPAPVATSYSPVLPQAPQANTDTEPEVTGAEGGKATLRCLFHGNPPPKITWRRGEITIDGAIDRYRLLSDGALEIVSLYRNDSGVYICIADNGLGTARQEIHLVVNDPVEAPVGIAGDDNAVVTGELNHVLNIHCLAYGYPMPFIQWFRGPSGTMVPYSSSLYEARGSVLQIRRLDYDTLGDYACQAYNGVGKPASWSVVVKAYRPDGDYSDNPYLVDRHHGLVVITPREPTTEATTTPLPEITVPVYTVPVSTRILSVPTTIASGAQLRLPCEVDGYPEPDVYWTKDGVPLVSSDRVEITDSRLTITLTNINDSGLYGCHARNAFSSHSSTVQITVEGLYIPPTCTDNPFFANCPLIVRSKFCTHKYYSKFCCKSCMEAGLLRAGDLDIYSE